MKTIHKITFAAGIMFALAFTGCGSDDNGGSGNSDGSYDPLSYQGKTYNTVRIGKQIWMAENMNYDVDGSRCYGEGYPLYSESEIQSNCDKYGRLYDWKTAMTVCPSGWHLPSNADWDKLYRYVDGDKDTGSPHESQTAGKYLKATSGWNESGNGIDKFGFSALPGGDGMADGSFGSFDQIGDSGSWWSSNELGSRIAYSRNMDNDDEGAYWSYSDKSFLYSVRCVKD